jgi:hypothetical protein
MPMNHETAEDPATEPGWLPARASDLQQEPAIPDDIVWPAGAAKPVPAIPKKAAAKKADDEDDAPAKKKAPAKKAEKKVEKATASKAGVEKR